MLSRKLLEALVIRVFEVVFPKIKNGSYDKVNYELWYNKDRSCYNHFEKLLSNLRARSNDFHEDKDLLEQSCDIVDAIRIEANKCVHKDYKIPNEDYLKTINIESAVVSTRKLYKKYCNP